ncbi:hypothetical protein WN944_014141 [Citrus x changshan-huyou]|uniref:Protein kinase domain-containing protein n=1 Tax=Citrus x changshan-huyou TaxID=2935761 RepID=A0AAP0M5C2_9ROSI
MPDGSLKKLLYSHNFFLDILERLNIMIDVGLTLEYLHRDLSTPMINCDLKLNNILLDENMVAYVSDFGISKLFGERDNSVTQTMTIAIIGYITPEYGSDLEGMFHPDAMFIVMGTRPTLKIQYLGYLTYPYNSVLGVPGLPHKTRYPGYLVYPIKLGIRGTYIPSVTRYGEPTYPIKLGT